MAKYAEGTTVSVQRSRAELETLLQRFGATRFAFGWDAQDNRQVIEFAMSGRQARMEVPMPSEDDPRITHTPTGKRRAESAIAEQYGNETRRRWRAFLAVVKAKLVAVDDGITTLEREFLADLITENGQTVEQVVRPYLAGDGPLQLTRGGGR